VWWGGKIQGRGDGRALRAVRELRIEVRRSREGWMGGGKDVKGQKGPKGQKGQKRTFWSGTDGRGRAWTFTDRHGLLWTDWGSMAVIV